MTVLTRPTHDETGELRFGPDTSFPVRSPAAELGLDVLEAGRVDDRRSDGGVGGWLAVPAPGPRPPTEAPVVGTA